MQAPLNTANGAWLSHLEMTLRYGENYNGTVERMSAMMAFDMQFPIIDWENRKVNHKFMLMEAHYILAGRNDIDYLTKAIKNFDTYSDDGHYQTGAYGPPFVDQMPYVVKCLTEDPSSRQAVITIWRPRPMKSKDIPCTLSLQFLIRDSELHCVVTMRSSDCWTGLVYDAFCFSMMAEAVLKFLPDNIRIGRCFITAGSSHLYDRDLINTSKLIAHPGLGQNRDTHAWIRKSGLKDLINILDVSHMEKQEVLDATFPF